MSARKLPQEMHDYMRFRIMKLERLLIPTIKEEMEKMRGTTEFRHYETMHEEYLLELRERKKRISYDKLKRVLESRYGEAQ